MQIKLDKDEISKAVADYVAKKVGREIRVFVEFDARATVVNGKQVDDAELVATVTIADEQGIQEAKANG